MTIITFLSIRKIELRLFLFLGFSSLQLMSLFGRGYYLDHSETEAYWNKDESFSIHFGSNVGTFYIFYFYLWN